MDGTRPRSRSDMLQVQTADLSLRPDGAPVMDHSPALSSKIVYPKRKYSRNDSLERVVAPIFTKAEQRMLKSGPASPGTVLSMAGLFICGLTLVLSGTIVLVNQEEAAFIITGCVFIGVGLAMLLVCVALQRKNVVKYVIDLNRDFYFLKISDSYMRRLGFEDSSVMGDYSSATADNTLPSSYYR